MVFHSNLKEIPQNSIMCVCHAEIHLNTLPNEGIGGFCCGDWLVVLFCLFLHRFI